jgi:hypothetical protein
MAPVSTTFSDSGPITVEPVCVSGSFDGETITTDPAPEELGELVMSRGAVLVKGAFGAQADDLLALRERAFRWAAETPPLEEPHPTENCHCLQSGVSRFQKTPHVFHSYNFPRPSQLPADLSAHLLRYLEPLSAWKTRLTGNAAQLDERFGDGPALHPQLIQYPAGGGYFGRHIHPLEPQRIGTIVGLSRRGVDFSSGGTCVLVDEGTVVDLERHHDIGDIALFRYDAPHWVNPSDLIDKFDWESPAGRWSMVLPYY